MVNWPSGLQHCHAWSHASSVAGKKCPFVLWTDRLNWVKSSTASKVNLQIQSKNKQFFLGRSVYTNIFQTPRRESHQTRGRDTNSLNRLERILVKSAVKCIHFFFSRLGNLLLPFKQRSVLCQRQLFSEHNANISMLTSSRLTRPCSHAASVAKS